MHNRATLLFCKLNSIILDATTLIQHGDEVLLMNIWESSRSVLPIFNADAKWIENGPRAIHSAKEKNEF